LLHAQPWIAAQALRDIAYHRQRIDDLLTGGEIVPGANAYNDLFADTGIAQKALDAIEQLAAEA